ncbi:hypothetical protein GCM10029963_40100 [Micromonospora andamanensis]
MHVPGPALEPRHRYQRGHLVGDPLGWGHSGRDRLGRSGLGGTGPHGQDQGVEPFRLGGQTDGEHAEPYLLETDARWIGRARV